MNIELYTATIEDAQHLYEIYQNREIAQNAMRICEQIHGCEKWELDTILQKKGNFHLYEKMGYHKTGKTERFNNKLTLVFS